MPEKPSFHELEKRIAELETEVHAYRKQLARFPGHLDPALLDAILNLFTTIVSNASNEIVVKGTDGRIILANKKFCTTSGLKKTAIYGKTSCDVFPLHFAKKQDASDKKVINTGKPSVFQDQIEKSDGVHHYDVKNFPICDAHGTIVATCSISTDITPHVFAEENLRISEERFRTAFHTSPDSILISGPDGIVIDINEGSTNLTGYSREEAIGKTLPELNIYESLDERNRILKQLMEKGSVQNIECRFVNKTGGIFTGLVSAKKIRLGDMDAYLSITRDISDIKAAEEALRESEMRFKDLAEMLPDAVFETDENLFLTYGNRQLFNLFSYPPEKAKDISWQDLIVAEDRERARANLTLRMKGEKIGPEEYEAVRSDGTTFPIMVNMNPIMSNNTFAGMRGTVIDLTNQKLAEAERARVKTQYLQIQKVEAIGRLAGGISHDLNNMLSPIIGYAELLLTEFNSEHPHQDSIQQIARAGYKARDLVHQLLAFSRKQTLEYTPLNLNHVLENFEKLLRRTIREDIEIKLVLSPDIGTITADIGQIEQVIMNLCVNAQDAMPDGGTLTLETAAVKLDEEHANTYSDVNPGEYVMLAVSDTGTGMDEKTKEQIFEPFFSTKGEQGTGLGLATVYGIVKQHDGNIWVYSEPDGGTVFKVFLPMEDMGIATSIAEKPEISVLTGNENILLVEDNDTVRNLVADILRPLGYSLKVATNATEALTLAANHMNTFDLVVTDVVMPDMNGKEMFTKMADVQPNAKVLYMSGYTDEVIAHRGVLDEGVHFVQKPFTIKALAKKVRELLEGSSDRSNGVL